MDFFFEGIITHTNQIRLFLLYKTAHWKKLKNWPNSQQNIKLHECSGGGGGGGDD